ncbi:MAG: hypothetical protein H6974_12795 [Gammaproteobacteria bacterium]|nr:hypothetical protein [Gammaproteobacteria bacterium]
MIISERPSPEEIQKIEAVLNAAEELLNMAEEFEFDDGLGKCAGIDYWNRLDDALDDLKEA